MSDEVCDYLPEGDDRSAGHDEVYSSMNERVVDGWNGLGGTYASLDEEASTCIHGEGRITSGLPPLRLIDV